MLSPDTLAYGVVATLAYAGVGLVVLAVGYLVLDLLTPGKLRHQVFVDGNANASLVAGAHVIALAAIIVTAIVTSDNDIVAGLLQTVVYGGLGVVLLAVGFKLLDLLTPDDLGKLIMDNTHVGAARMTAVSTLAMGAVMAASIS